MLGGDAALVPQTATSPCENELPAFISRVPRVGRLQRVGPDERTARSFPTEVVDDQPLVEELLQHVRVTKMASSMVLFRLKPTTTADNNRPTLAICINRFLAFSWRSQVQTVIT